MKEYQYKHVNHNRWEDYEPPIAPSIVERNPIQDSAWNLFGYITMFVLAGWVVSALMCVFSFTFFPPN